MISSTSIINIITPIEHGLPILQLGFSRLRWSCGRIWTLSVLRTSFGAQRLKLMRAKKHPLEATVFIGPIVGVRAGGLTEGNHAVHEV